MSLLRIGRSGVPVLWNAAGRRLVARFLRGQLKPAGKPWTQGALRCE